MKPEEQTTPEEISQEQEISQEPEPEMTAAGSSRDGGGSMVLPLNPNPPR